MSKCEKKAVLGAHFTPEDIIHKFARPLWNERSLDLVDQFLDEDADIQTTFISGKGPDCLKKSAEDTFLAFPNLEMQIEEAIQQGNKLIYKWEAYARHEGTILGIPGSGIKTHFSGLVYGEINEDKIAVYHSFSNLPQILRSIQALCHNGQVQEEGLDQELRKLTNLPLTPREVECLRHWIQGFSIKDCAKQMGGLSERTVQTYRETIKHKFNARNYQALVSILQKNGILTLLLE